MLLPISVVAQDLPRLELFGGYSYFQIPSGFFPDFNAITTETARLNGWNAAALVNVNRWLGAEADFGGYYGDARASGRFTFVPVTFNQEIATYTFLFGPRVSYRAHDRFIPFVHALFGTVVLSNTPVTNTSASSLGVALGGGLEITASPHFAIRAIQADYLRSHLSPEVENNFRLSAGAVLRF